MSLTPKHILSAATSISGMIQKINKPDSLLEDLKMRKSYILSKQSFINEIKRNLIGQRKNRNQEQDKTLLKRDTLSRAKLSFSSKFYLAELVIFQVSLIFHCLLI